MFWYDTAHDFLLVRKILETGIRVRIEEGNRWKIMKKFKNRI